MHLSARVGSGAKQQLPLKNAGNIGVHLKIKVCWLLSLEVCAVTVVLKLDFNKQIFTRV